MPASKVKTITYPGESEFSGPEFLPVPETTFECDALLAENLDKFIDDAKVRRCFSFRAKSNYFFRKHSKIGNPEKENGLIWKLIVTDNAKIYHVNFILKRCDAIKHENILQLALFIGTL